MHIALIPDGNRRWSRLNNLSVHEGHKRGGEVMESILNHINLNHSEIYTVSVYALSHDNLLKRTKSELASLFTLFTKLLNKLDDDRFRINVIGYKTNLPNKLLAVVNEINSLALHLRHLNHLGDVKTLNILLDSDVFHSINNSVDLLIRTGGRYSTSSFSPNDIRYAELRFHDMLWCDYSPTVFDVDIEWFTNQIRKFGG